MANETAHPLYWPKGQKRTRPQDRLANAPFSIGENYQKIERRYEQGQIQEHTVQHRRTKAVSIPVAVERLEDQLRRLDGQHPVLSTNLELRLNGSPRAGQRDPEDAGAAVYFTLKGKRTVLACDKWLRVADNIAALAAHIRAIRSVESYGVGTLEQAFAGYVSIEDFSTGVPWRRVLGFPLDSQPHLEEVETKWRSRMKELHPDASNDPQTHAQAVQLNTAIQEARKELRAAA